MIRVRKDIDRDGNPRPVPRSLQVLEDVSDRSRSTKKQRTTHARRMEVIAQGAWIEGPRFKSRYKQSDVKAALKDIYNRKCAYCEQRVESWQVEHFRPKSIYYWLAYSWDNLLYACPRCNARKGDKFPISGPRASHHPADIKNIHQLAENYRSSEQPILLHPEHEDPEPLMCFDRDGHISSENARAHSTITICDLDRQSLCDERQTILDDLKRRLATAIAATGDDPRQQQSRIKEEIDWFKREAHDEPKRNFLGFRRYALRHLIKPILNDLQSPTAGHHPTPSGHA